MEQLLKENYNSSKCKLKYPSLLIPHLKVTGVCWAPQAGSVKASPQLNKQGREDGCPFVRALAQQRI